jgi:hypothetical protein
VVLGATAPRSPTERSFPIVNAKAVAEPDDGDHSLTKPLMRAAPADDYVS